MRAALLLLLALAVVAAVVNQAAAVPLDSESPDAAAVHRVRREGEINIEAERQKGEKSKATVSGQGNVWKGEGSRRVDVTGSADTRGNRRAGVGFKW